MPEYSSSQQARTAVLWGRALTATGLLTAILVAIMMAQTGWAGTDAGTSVSATGQSPQEAPPHMNHTSLVGKDVYLVGDEFVIHAVALGDVVGVPRAREIVLWAEYTNLRDRSWLFFPSGIKVRVDGAPWRRPVCHSGSVPRGTIYCYDVMDTYWLDGPVEIGPNTTMACWMVYRLPKSEFDNMALLYVNYSDLVTSISVSPSRQTQITPALEVRWPKDGQTLTEFESIRFFVWDNFLTVNWTIRMDGETLANGSLVTGDTRCPKVYDRSVPSGLVGDGPHQLVVSITDGRYADEVAVNFAIDSKGLLRLQPKWVFNASDQFATVFGAGLRGGFTVWDLDGDGVDEVVFATKRGASRRVWCIDGRGGFRWVYPPIDGEGLPGDVLAKASLVDLDQDGGYELSILVDDGSLHALGPDGSRLWVWLNPRGSRGTEGAPQAMDVDADGRVEFFLTDDGGYLSRVDDQGGLVWSVPVALEGPQGPPTVADVDRDGELEVLWTSLDRYVYCASAQDGALEWRYNTYTNMSGCQLVVMDLDGDGEYEVLTWGGNSPSVVLVLSFYGEEIASWYSPEDEIRFGQALGDVDLDGRMDLVIMSNRGMFCLDLGLGPSVGNDGSDGADGGNGGVADNSEGRGDGAVGLGVEVGLGGAGGEPFVKWSIDLAGWVDEGVVPEGAVANSWSSYQLIADVDGDGEEEVLWLAPFPIVTDGATGRLEAYYLNDHVARSKPQGSGAWWGDVDDDGVSEWVVELAGRYHQGTQVYALTMGGIFPARSSWPEYLHSASPGVVQASESWMAMRASSSNSLWFPIPEAFGGAIVMILLLGVRRIMWLTWRQDATNGI